ncbi:MAG: ribbon-helix-helix protein, CopG family [Nitrospirae bacterium]|nr:MAG: ribbon-helix-helix protein, CopG family [Nitrospirota bacterium]
MRTIQMTLDDKLVVDVDKMVKKLKTTRSAFARKALQNALKQVNAGLLERKHRKGYERHPSGKNEFSVWESEQEWGD